MTPFDWLLFRRSLAATGFALLLAAGIVAATDEVTSTVAMRVARLAAFTPFVAALSALAVVVHAHSRGEVSSLVALGNTHARAGGGAALSALFSGAAALAVLASPLSDASSLFPAVHAGVAWAFDGDGSAARALGMVVASSGRVTLQGSAARESTTALASVLALPCLGPIALLAPAWSVVPMPRFGRASSLVVSEILVVTLLHLIAGARLPALAGLASGVPLALALASFRERPRAG